MSWATRSTKPVDGSTNPTIITANRRRSIAAALFVGLFTFIGLARSISGRSIGGVVITLLVLGPAFAFAVHLATRRKPMLVIDAKGLTEGRSGRFVAWNSVTTIRVGNHRGMFGESHHLVVRLSHEGPPPPRRFISTNATNPRELDINLDWLSRPWNDVVTLVERAFGRPVVVREERGFQRI